ncbi:MAG: hypothetical protein ACR2RB_04110 [Gammaproteobacteria bacterium]
MAVATRTGQLRRVLWFVALWAAGVLSVAGVGLVLRLVLAP